MIRFECDYGEGANEKILNALIKTNMEQTPGYGEDAYCDEARELIKKACGNDDLYVQFLVGGTQANMTVIAAALKPYEGALCAETGHINVHETGAVEATGHKVLGLPAKDGKITAEQIKNACYEQKTDSAFEHIVKPGMVYISNPTECGTLYSKAELTAISEVCKEYGIYLFIDGARLGYGLVAKDNDLTLKDYAELSDVFYIGGTKIGLLMGEAVVISNKAIAKDFRYMIKQRGGMLAKGRLLGVQFKEAFTDDLYIKMSENAIKLADKLTEALKDLGFEFYYTPQTNQLFPIINEKQEAELEKDFAFSETKRLEGKKVIRFCTSWATKAEDVDALIAKLGEIASL